MQTFVIVIRTEFGSSLLSGFTKNPFRISISCTWQY